MHFKHLLLVALATTAVSVVASTASFAQYAEATGAFSAPRQGGDYYANSAGACPITFSTGGYHQVIFYGPINGTISWSGSIKAYKGNALVFWDPANIETDKISDGDSATVVIAAGKNQVKTMNCHATALYSATKSTGSYTGKGKVTTTYTIPGVTPPTFAPNEVTFTVHPAP